MNYDELEDWALRTVQALQDTCDEAQIIKGKPFAEDEHPDLRALIREHQRIASGQPSWRMQLELAKQQPITARKENS